MSSRLIHALWLAVINLRPPVKEVSTIKSVRLRIILPVMGLLSPLCVQLFELCDPQQAEASSSMRPARFRLRNLLLQMIRASGVLVATLMSPGVA